MTTNTLEQSDALHDTLTEFLSRTVLVRYLLSKLNDRSWETFTAEIVSVGESTESSQAQLIHVRAVISYSPRVSSLKYAGYVFQSLEIVPADPQHPVVEQVASIVEGWLAHRGESKAYELWAASKPFVGVVEVRPGTGAQELECGLYDAYLPDFALYTGMLLARLQVASENMNRLISHTPGLHETLQHLRFQFADEIGRKPHGTRGALPDTNRL